MSKTKNYEPIRLQAKELGIKNWHLKKVVNLEAEIEKIEDAMEQRDGASGDDSNVSRVSFGQLLDILDQYALNNLTDAFDSLDLVTRKYYSDLVESFDKNMHSHPPIGKEVDIGWMHNRTQASCNKHYSEESFRDFIDAVCKVYSGRGWYVDRGRDVLVMRDSPVFKLSWHVSLWEKSNSNRNVVYRLLSILSQPDNGEADNEQEEE